MLMALELAKAHKARKVHCYGDSELIVFQLQGRYRIKDPDLKKLAEKVKLLAAEFESVTYQQVPREHPMIRRADKQVNQALDNAGRPGAASPAMPSTRGKRNYFNEDFFPPMVVERDCAAAHGSLSAGGLVP